jgi:hypothetical protein
MASRSIFHMRVIRCPSCGASLPVQGREPQVTCDYCDARVEIVRGSATPPPQPRTGTPKHRANAHYSAFAWIMFSAVFFVGITAVVTFAVLGTHIGEVSGQSDATATTPSRAEVIPSDEPMPVATPQPPPSEPTDAPSPDDPEPKTDDGGSDIAPKPARRAKPKPPKPTGPLISKAEAAKQLEPKILACMRKHKTHSLLAWMGNKNLGGVSVLKSPQPRVDGARVKLASTALGRCINDAGKSVNTRANKSNYIRFDLKNASVPDPLARLPAKADRKAIRAIIESADPKVLECAKKHGEVGTREVFYLTIDGPSGRVISARASYRSRAFKRCAVPHYKKLVFPKVREHEVKFTHDLRM